MAGELRNFLPDQVTVTWSPPGGALDLTQGLIDGAGAIVETKDNPNWTRRGDRNGNYVRNRRRPQGGFLTLTYVAEAELQSVLSGLRIADFASATIVGVCIVRDLNGDTVMRYDGFFIENDPPTNFGNIAADRPWVFGFAQRVPFIGGAAVVA